MQKKYNKSYTNDATIYIFNIRKHNCNNNSGILESTELNSIH